MKIKKLFVQLLKEIVNNAANNKITNFSGIGLVLYSSKSFSRKHHSDLRPSIKCPENIWINDGTAVDFLLNVSKKYHPCHDGYHFINEKGQLTDIAQYFWPPIVPEIKPNEQHGTRDLSAKYGSCIKGVIAIGIVHSDYQTFYFEKGEEHRLFNLQISYTKIKKVNNNLVASKNKK